ncbi:MAG: hypothetical protein GY849_02305 [Deltaproteobacteria bacterium]|nr:hypothetical protein [Deltaproteobacteria bacterium]
MKKQIILDTVEDLVSSFLYYDRKDDENLERGEIQKAITEKQITIDEIISHFSKNLKSSLSVTN